MSEKYFSIAPGSELRVIDELIRASTRKNEAIVSALRCLRSMKVRVDGVCWSDGDQAALVALEKIAHDFELKVKP